ncbi:hypothetical protein [Streptomyces mutabilis]|uniref:Uncharacterized protein n=1 Tax=Streptomyces mutabilis TaxID=67332 RepID=A0A086MXZ2_9ACTN|nr:hypothetical protein [Streptomyces mutabilis]KFG73760.1 hypothetical protein FM21_23520 [Streptomyces mutabilis]
MTAQETVTVGADARDRVHAVRHRYARRGDRASAGGRAYTVYLVALFGVFFLVPALLAAADSPGPVSVGTPTDATPMACALVVTACWGAQVAARFWGPLVLQPFDCSASPRRPPVFRILLGRLRGRGRPGR